MWFAERICWLVTLVCVLPTASNAQVVKKGAPKQVTAMPKFEFEDSPNGRLLKACTEDGDNIDDVKAALAEGADYNHQAERSQQSALMIASMRGKPKIVQHLLDLGADATLRDRKGYGPVDAAGFQGRVEVMELLKKHGVDLMVKHEDGFLPFHRACWGAKDRHTDVVKFFLDVEKVDIELRATGEHKKTCLELAVNEGTKKLLLERGAKQHDEL